jgi:hypothetical protein
MNKLYDSVTTFHGSGRREDLNRPHSCCWNGGALFVTDTLNNRIVQVFDIPRPTRQRHLPHDPAAGKSPPGDQPDTDGRMYRTVGTSTSWMFPLGMVSVPCYFRPEKPGDEQRLGSLLVVCDSGHNRVKLLFVPTLPEYRARREAFYAVDPDVFSREEPGHVLTLAGNGKRGMQNGPAAKATFDRPSGVCIAADGSILVADAGNHCVRRISLRRPAPPKAYQSPIHRHRYGRGGGGGGGLADASVNELLKDFNTAERHGIKKAGVVGALAEWAATGSLNCLPPGMELVVTTIVGGGTRDDRKRAALQEAAIREAQRGGSVQAVADLISAAADDNVAPSTPRGGGAAIPASTSGLRDGVGREALFNGPVDLLLDRHGRVLVADQNNDCIRMLRKRADGKWGATTLREQKLGGGTGGGEGSKADRQGGEEEGGDDPAPPAALVLPKSKWRTALFNRPGSLCHVDGRNLQEGLFLVAHKHAISLVAFDFVSEAQDDAAASRVSHFVLSGEEDAPKRTAPVPAHGYQDAEDVGEARYWNPRGLAVKPGMDIIVADASNCVIRQLSRGGIPLARAIRAPGVATAKKAGKAGKAGHDGTRRKSHKLAITNSREPRARINGAHLRSPRRRATARPAARLFKARATPGRASTPVRNAKEVAESGMGSTMGSILKRSYKTGGSGQGYLDDVRRILTAPGGRKGTPKGRSPKGRSPKGRSPPMDDREKEEEKREAAPTPTPTPSRGRRKSFQEALREDVHERDTVEKKKERRKSVTQAHAKAGRGPRPTIMRRVTQLQRDASGGPGPKGAPTRYSRRPSSPHLVVAASPKTDRGVRRESVRFAGLKKLRRSKMEILEARKTRERLRSMAAAKSKQTKKMLKKGGGRMSVVTESASEMAVHQFHPSMSRRRTSLF